jgi:thiol-disulfide isomerase/thioredoxin
MLIHAVKVITMRKIFLLPILFFSVIELHSQSVYTRSLVVGDTMPDIVLSDFMDNSKPIRVNDLKGKLVIFDLWNVWCSTCVKLMPSLDTLQQKFGNKIKIILVTDSKRAAVQKLFTKVKLPGLPMMVNDTVLNKLFPHTTVPQQVWIDPDGKVQFITDAYNANMDNIQAVLDNKPVKLFVRKETANFNFEQSLLEEGDGRLRYHLKYYSFFMNRLNEFNGTFSSFCNIDSTSGIMRTKIVNQPLLYLYKLAFGISIPDGLTDLYSKELSDKRIVLEVKDPDNFDEPLEDSKKDHWFSQNTFSYESAIPIQNPEMSYAMLQQDLNRFFPYSARIEKRKVRCFVLKRIPGQDKIVTHHQKAALITNENNISVQNFSTSSFVSLLSDIIKEIPIPIVDGTGYNKNIDITVTRKFSDIHGLVKNLRKYDLDLVGEVRDIDMLVISDK